MLSPVKNLAAFAPKRFYAPDSMTKLLILTSTYVRSDAFLTANSFFNLNKSRFIKNYSIYIFTYLQSPFRLSVSHSKIGTGVNCLTPRRVSVLRKLILTVWILPFSSLSTPSRTQQVCLSISFFCGSALTTPSALPERACFVL